MRPLFRLGFRERVTQPRNRQCPGGTRARHQSMEASYLVKRPIQGPCIFRTVGSSSSRVHLRLSEFIIHKIYNLRAFREPHLTFREEFFCRPETFCFAHKLQTSECITQFPGLFQIRQACPEARTQGSSRQTMSFLDPREFLPTS